MKHDSEVWGFRCRSAWILVVRGDLDISSCALLSGSIDQALDANALTLLLDLEETTFFDAAALAALLTHERRAQERGVGMKLIAPSPAVLRLLSLAQLQDHFEIHDDLVEAYLTVDGQDPLLSASA